MFEKKGGLLNVFQSGDLKEEWECYFKFLLRWMRAFRSRMDDRRDLAIDETAIEKKLILWKESDRAAKDEESMKPDAQMAQRELRNKGAKALEDLSWIEVKVDVEPNEG